LVELVFGGTYSASVVEAFYVFNACGVAGSGGNCSGAFPVSSGGFVYTNTYFQPIALSWKLGGGQPGRSRSQPRRRRLRETAGPFL
jgi:hypothetical protein